MKQILFIIIALLAISAVAFGQPAGKQPLPNFVGNDTTVAGYNKYGRGWGIGKFTGGVQGVRSGMLHGPHDFTPDSGKVFTVDSLTNPGIKDTLFSATGNKRLCSYCHAAHVPKEGVARPLWVRKSVMGQTFGKYDNPSSLDATVYDPGDPAGQTDNYSSMCMSCHDGSVGIFADTKYESGGTVGDVSHVPDAANMKDGEFDLAHVHPVNFDYNAVQAKVPEELYPAVDPVSAVWKGYAGTNGQFGASGSNYTTVRLFNGWMQCSSCHNPHMSSGIGTVITSDYGRRCIACHKK
jgi:predicted CXXCH cytochrome family protein